VNKSQKKNNNFLPAEQIPTFISGSLIASSF
jgi:hypothetical protein